MRARRVAVHFNTSGLHLCRPRTATATTTRVCVCVCVSLSLSDVNSNSTRKITALTRAEHISALAGVFFQAPRVPSRPFVRACGKCPAFRARRSCSRRGLMAAPTRDMTSDEADDGASNGRPSGVAWIGRSSCSGNRFALKKPDYYPTPATPPRQHLLRLIDYFNCTTDRK